MTSGIFDLPWWGVILAALAMTHFTIIGVTVFLHRNQAQRALDLHPAVQFVFRLWLWLTTGMQTKQWVAIHRKHHAFVETTDDPHSPLTHGIRKVLWQGAELYRKEAGNSQTAERYGHGTPDDWFERHVFTQRDKLGITTMLILDVMMFGPIGLTVWAVQMAWIPFFAAGVINGAAHWWGYRNFETTDRATNLVPWGVLIGGEELHNNHHAFASSARFSVKPWEFDVGWLYIRILARLGLAKVKKLAPVTTIDRNKGAVDNDTLTTLLGAQWHVLADYGNQVLGRVHKEQLKLAANEMRGVLKRVKPLMFKNESLLSDKQRSMLAEGLAENSPLAVVYEFRSRLQSIFHERTASHEKLLQQLQVWCRNAEQSGIAALEEFAATIGAYTLRPEKYASM